LAKYFAQLIRTHCKKPGAVGQITDFLYFCQLNSA
jgi:hypothetical protein